MRLKKNTIGDRQMKLKLLSFSVSIGVLILGNIQPATAVKVCVEKNANIEFLARHVMKPCRKKQKLLLPRIEDSPTQGVKKGFQAVGNDLKNMGSNLQGHYQNVRRAVRKRNVRK